MRSRSGIPCSCPQALLPHTLEWQQPPFPGWQGTRRLQEVPLLSAGDLESWFCREFLTRPWARHSCLSFPICKMGCGGSLPSPPLRTFLANTLTPWVILTTCFVHKYGRAPPVCQAWFGTLGTHQRAERAKVLPWES